MLSLLQWYPVFERLMYMQVLSHSLSVGGSFCYIHFTKKETEAQSVNYLPNSINPAFCPAIQMAYVKGPYVE
jgi:hypothetical protein